MRGVCHLAMGKVSLALADFDEAVRISMDPNRKDKSTDLNFYEILRAGRQQCSY